MTQPRLFKVLRGFFPSKLPLTKQEFTDFSSSIFEAYQLPDMPSYRHAIATMVMHLSPLTTWKAKYYFAASIRKAMSNQIAYDIIQDIKEAEKAKESSESEPVQ